MSEFKYLNERTNLKGGSEVMGVTANLCDPKRHLSVMGLIGLWLKGLTICTNKRGGSEVMDLTEGPSTSPSLTRMTSIHERGNSSITVLTTLQPTTP
jgi:hypothetical protein